MERSLERIRYHYEVEKELALRLKMSEREDRIRLYGEVYDELFKRVSDHPQIIGKKDLTKRKEELNWQLKLIKKNWNGEGTFLEIGAGDCALSYEISKTANKVIGYDVSSEVAKNEKEPENFDLIIGDGIDIQVESNCIDFAYSNQLMEHLHPEDAEDQLKNIFESLKDGGNYFCVTPNKICGPHDISMHFDKVAMGFHLKEYDNKELGSLFLKTGFRKVQVVYSFKNWSVNIPWKLQCIIESLIEKLVGRWKLRKSRFMGRILGIYMIGTK